MLSHVHNHKTNIHPQSMLGIVPDSKNLQIDKHSFIHSFMS